MRQAPTIQISSAEKSRARQANVNGAVRNCKGTQSWGASEAGSTCGWQQAWRRRSSGCRIFFSSFVVRRLLPSRVFSPAVRALCSSGSFGSACVTAAAHPCKATALSLHAQLPQTGLRTGIRTLTHTRDLLSGILQAESAAAAPSAIFNPSHCSSCAALT